MFSKLPQKINQLRLYYIIEILLAVGGTFIHTTFYIYLTSNLGLTNAQAMFLDTVFFIGVFFLEVPTGILGDRYGRKFSFVLAELFFALSHLVYFAFNNYMLLIGGSLLFSLGMAFKSGAFEAWIVDQVGEKKISKIFVNRDIIRKIAVVIVPVISVFVAERTSYGFPYFVAFMFCTLIMLIALFFMKEDVSNIKRTESEKRGFEMLKDIGKDSVKSIFKSKTLKVLAVGTVFYSLASIAVYTYSSKFLEIGLGASRIGIVISMGSLVSIVASFLVNKLELLEKWFFGLGVIGAVSLIVLGVASGEWLLIVLFITQVVCLSLFGIQYQTAVNRNIKSNRSTMLSIFSFMNSIGGVLGTLVFGVLADILTVKLTFSVVGIVMLGAFWMMRDELRG